MKYGAFMLCSWQRLWPKPKKCIPTRHNFPVFCRESADLVALCRFTQIPTTSIPTVASCLWLHMCIYSKTVVLSSNPARQKSCLLSSCLLPLKRLWSWHSVVSPAEGASLYDDVITPTKSKGAFYIINLTMNNEHAFNWWNLLTKAVTILYRGF